MSDMEQVYERLRVVEQSVALDGQKLDRVQQDLDQLETHKIDPMVEKVDAIHETLTRGRGFVGGIMVSVSAFWGVVIAVGAGIWKLLGGE